MICNKCNAQLPDDATFCTECGQKVEAAIPETPVEQPVVEETTPNVASEVVEKVTATAKNVVKKVKKTVPAQYLKLGLIAVAAILVIVIIAALAGGSKSDGYALYVKDGSLFSANMPNGKKVVEITNKLIDADMDEELNLYMTESLSSFCRLSSDGKTLFYADRIDEEGYTLYCRNITNMKKEPVKIDSDMTDVFNLNEKGNLVTYLKEGTLYQHNLKEKTKIHSDVTSYRVSPDGKTLLYLVWEEGEDAGTLYLKKGNKDAEKVSGNVTSLMYSDEDLGTILYKKDADLYLKKGSKDAQKIASDVKSVYNYQNGSFYYTKGEESETVMWDFIKDDYSDKESYEYEYYAEWLKEEIFDMSVNTLYFYNGKEAKVISETMREFEGRAAESSTILFTASESEDLPKISLTKFINGEVSLYDEVYNKMYENSQFYIAVKDTVVAVEMEDMANVRLSSDGKTLYVGADLNEKKNEVTLYEIAVNGGKLKEAKKLDEDVHRNFYLYGDAGLVYFKDVKNEEGEMYWKGKKVDDDVYMYSVSFNTETKDMYYFVDYDEDDEQGTLKYSNGRKAVVVKDDVSSAYFFTESGETVFMYDYNFKKSEGELWVQSGKKVVKIDEDVAGIIPLY